MRRTFLPRYGAEARKFARSNYKPFCNGGEHIAKQLQMSCKQEQPQQHQEGFSNHRSGIRSTGSYSPSRTSLSRTRSQDAPNASQVTNTLLKNYSEPSILLRVAPSRVARNLHQPSSTSLLGGLVAAARREVNLTELPSAIKGQRSPCSATHLPPLSSGNTEVRVPPRCPQLWNLQEESKNLTRELERLGKPQEPMKWANPEVENQWLRREATYELFKALVGGCGSP